MSYHVTERQQKKTTHHPHGQQVVLYQISSIPDKTCRRLVQNWYRNEEIYILWNFIKRRYVCFLHFTAQSASSWGCCKIRLCFRPTESNSIHEIGRFRWEQSNKLQHCPRKLYTVLVKTPFSGVLTVTRTAFGAGGRT